MQEKNSTAKQEKKQNKRKWNWWILISIIFFIIIVFLSFFILLRRLPYSISMSSYRFMDSKDVNFDSHPMIEAEGSWLSTTNLAYPLQTVQIKCWEDLFCTIATSEVDEQSGFLYVDTELIPVSKWTDAEVKTVPQQAGSGCVEYQYTIDRNLETVISTRRTLKTDGACRGVQTEPIIMNLGDGYDRFQDWAKQHPFFKIW